MIYKDTKQKQNGTKYAYRSISKLTLQAFRTVKRRSYSLEWWLSIQPPIPNPQSIQIPILIQLLQIVFRNLI